MTLSHIILILAAVVNAVLGFIVYLRNKKSKQNISFALIALGIAIWCVGMAIFRSNTTYKVSVFMGELVHFGAGLIALAFLKFSFEFPYRIKSSSRLLNHILFFFALLILISVFIKGLVIKDVQFFGQNKGLTYGFGYVVYSIYIFLFFGWGFKNLIHKYLHSIKISKLQLKYLFIGFFVSASIGITTNLLLPAFSMFNFNWIGPVSTIIMVSFISYSILKYRLLDIRILLGRTVIYIIIISLVSIPIILILVYLSQFYAKEWGAGSFLISLFFAFLIVFGLEPFKKFISRITDKYLFKGKIDYQEVTKHISKIINQELKLTNLIRALADDLKQQLKLDKAAILLAKNGSYEAEIKHDDQKKIINLPKNSALVKDLLDKQKILVREEIDRQISDFGEKEEVKSLEGIKSLLDQYDFSLASPIVSDQGLIAILLGGNKLTGEIYSNEDIKFFELLSPQIAIAISRSYLYRDLENKVDELSELYKLTYLLSKTLKLEESLDYVMDAVVRLTGCDRGLLYLIDEKNKILAAAVGKGDEKELYEGIKIKISESILQKVIVTKKPLIVKDAVRTPGVAKYAIERLGTKAFIAVPMMVKDQVIGVIGVDNQKTGRPLSDINISLLQTLAGHAAVAVEDARLYEELNEFNRTLQQKVEKATKEIRKLYEMKGEFLDIASHQLRTPVSVIIGTLDMLQEGSIQKLPKSQQKKFIENAYRKGRKLESIINDILNASEMDTGKFDVQGTTKPVQIEDLIDKVMTDFENEAAERGLEFIFVKPAQLLPLIEVSPRYLEQVLSNLIDNAIKYTKQGSVKVEVSRKNNQVVIAVKDTGIGIPQGDLPKLFHKFIRAKNARDTYTDGSGLGLFIIKKIVEGHQGGKVWVESQEGQGSSFYVSFPVSKGDRGVKGFKGGFN